MSSRGLAKQIRTDDDYWNAPKELYEATQKMPGATFNFQLPMPVSDAAKFGAHATHDRSGRGVDLGKSVLVRFYPDGSYGTYPMPQSPYGVQASALRPYSTPFAPPSTTGLKGYHRDSLSELITEIEDLVAEKRVADYKFKKSGERFLRRNGMGRRAARSI